MSENNKNTKNDESTKMTHHQEETKPRKKNKNILTKYSSEMARVLTEAIEMRKNFLQGFILITIFVFAFEFSGVWWLAFVGGVIGGLLLSKNSGISAFFSGLLGGGLGWGIHMSAIAFYNPLDRLNLITSRFGWNAGSVVMITLAVGGLLGALGAICGRFLIQIINYHSGLDEERSER